MTGPEPIFEYALVGAFSDQDRAKQTAERIAGLIADPALDVRDVGMVAFIRPAAPHMVFVSVTCILPPPDAFRQQVEAIMTQEALHLDSLSDQEEFAMAMRRINVMMERRGQPVEGRPGMRYFHKQHVATAIDQFGRAFNEDRSN